MNEEMKACPLCGESILVVAKKCKHCGSMIDEAAIEKPVRVSIILCKRNFVTAEASCPRTE
jgi:predicted Zn-ribbon and HTH transcriptional regulator